ncbi:MAG TPA: DNA alkylation repair protein [Candidatus Omnitrophota bacterium]|nr:DNA alkylation repair protein [Candidatus Omnitrophota bacterium]HPD85671.1 DNA alkylation repair protein [Candidatus Omnitrophota bacterium]HRZ04514.1 DNA alkylation repair protein [Candidatus Omnitrophota bacterium]
MKYRSDIIKPILKELHTHANPRNVAGMARFGINPKDTLGVSIPVLRQMAKRIGKNHAVALALWRTGIHEARLLAAFIDDYAQVDKRQMEDWVNDFDSWDVCDQVCSNLFDKTPFAFSTAKCWSRRKKEFVRRAGFTLMATLAVHAKDAKNKDFVGFFPFIKKGAFDERNYVRKAVNWALRQIGKRNRVLREKSIILARQIYRMDTSASRWIAADALRELAVKKFKN